jgi:hypothetical protein
MGSILIEFEQHQEEKALIRQVNGFRASRIAGVRSELTFHSLRRSLDLAALGFVAAIRHLARGLSRHVAATSSQPQYDTRLFVPPDASAAAEERKNYRQLTRVSPKAISADTIPTQLPRCPTKCRRPIARRRSTIASEIGRLRLLQARRCLRINRSRRRQSGADRPASSPTSRSPTFPCRPRSLAFRILQ